MANARVGNVIYIDATGSVSDEKNLRVSQVIFTSSGAGDAIEFRESSTGGTKLYFKQGVANDSKALLQNGELIFFANGIYVQSISSGAKAMLILAGATGGGA